MPFPVLGAIGAGVGLYNVGKSLFGGGGKKSGNQPFSLQSLGIGPDQMGDLITDSGEKQSQIDQLLRSIGSLQSQSLNRIDGDLPLNTQLSQQRGISLQGAQAARQGTLDIERQVAGGNREALLNLLGMQLRNDLAQQGFDADRQGQMLGLLGGLGQAAGTYFGMKG